jgi:NAD(P)-dependent dehydrogenase (short-subunit alcohol dehydrogenase family)
MNEPSAQPVALITGAANGIGRAIAQEFHAAGYALALVDLDAAKLAEVAAALAGQVPPLLHTGDLADLGFCQRLVSATAQHFGRLDVLVNNAAIHGFFTIREMTEEAWEKMIRVNLTVPAFMAKYAAEVMEPQHRGVIVTIDGSFAKGVCPAYAASKSGLINLTHELAVLFGPVGLRAVLISPGAINTTMSLHYRDHAGNDMTQELLAATDDLIPLGRWGEASEIAKVVVWAASDSASYVTGTEITVDGGWSPHNFPYRFARAMRPSEFPVKGAGK